MFFLTASFSFAIDPNDKKLNLDELLKNSNDKIAELDNKIKNKTSNEPASPKKSTQVTNETPKPVIEKAHLTQLRSESTSPDRMTDNLALKMAREQHKGDLTEPTAEDIEQFKKDIEDSSFSKVNSKSSDLSQNNFNIVPRDILAKDRLNSIKSRVNLLMLDRKKSVIPSTDDELIYTNNLLNSSNNQKQELIKRTQLSVLSFYNTPMNKFMMDYSFDHYYYSYHPRFNRAVNEINFNSNLFTNKRLKINIFDGFKPFGSTDPGGTDQLASVSWYNNNRFRPSLSYEVSPRTYFNFAYENYYNNWATNKINREYSVLTHSYTPSIKYSYSQLTDFELFYTLKTAEYFNRKDPDYYSNGTALSMMTKLRRNNFIGTSLGFTQRNYFNEYKNYSGLEHSVDYKLLPTKSTLYMLSAKSGIEDSSSVPPSYLFFNSISSTFSHYLLSPDLQFTMTGLYKRTTPSMSTTPLDDIKNQIDNYYLLGTLLEYRLARNIFLDLKYSFAMRDSNKDSAQTKESRYMLELKVDELFNLYPKK